METMYKCGCVYSSNSKSCPYHNIPVSSESGGSSEVRKIFRKSKSKIIVDSSTSSVEGKFDIIRISNVDLDYKELDIKRFLKKDSVVIVDTFNPKKCKKYLSKLLPFAAELVTLAQVNYASKIYKSHGHQLIFTKRKSIPQMPVIGYRGSEGLLDAYWISNFEARSLLQLFATENSTFVPAVKKKIKFTIHTQSLGLAKTLVDRDYKKLMMDKLSLKVDAHPI